MPRIKYGRVRISLHVMAGLDVPAIHVLDHFRKIKEDVDARLRGHDA
jgi:hypothetical protein